VDASCDVSFLVVCGNGDSDKRKVGEVFFCGEHPFFEEGEEPESDEVQAEVKGGVDDELEWFHG